MKRLFCQGILFLDLGDIDRIGALVTFFDFELYSVAICDGTFDIRLVDKYVRAFFSLYESIAFYSVKPLDRSSRHGTSANNILLDDGPSQV